MKDWCLRSDAEKYKIIPESQKQEFSAAVDLAPAPGSQPAQAYNQAQNNLILQQRLPLTLVNQNIHHQQSKHTSLAAVASSIPIGTPPKKARLSKSTKSQKQPPLQQSLDLINQSSNAMDYEPRQTRKRVNYQSYLTYHQLKMEVSFVQ